MKDSAKRQPNSAFKVLANKENKALKIYPGASESFEEEEEAKESGGSTDESKTKKNRRSYYLFQDLVEQHYQFLEQTMDHQIHLAGQNGVKLKTRVQKHLEGWDFVGLAMDHDPYPRVAILDALGWGWVEFIRSFDAIALFGNGFGDIIRPIEFGEMCLYWKSLPTQKYYLAASLCDLNKIMTHEKVWPHSGWLSSAVENLLWYCPGDFIAPCTRCSRHSPRSIIKRALHACSHLHKHRSIGRSQCCCL